MNMCCYSQWQLLLFLSRNAHDCYYDHTRIVAGIFFTDSYSSDVAMMIVLVLVAVISSSRRRSYSCSWTDQALNK